MTRRPGRTARGRYSRGMPDNAERIITATDMDKMTPQERADAVDAATVRSWDDVPEPFRTEVLATAKMLGQQRRQRA